jgi:hypothetical protein
MFILISYIIKVKFLIFFCVLKYICVLTRRILRSNYFYWMNIIIFKTNIVFKLNIILQFQKVFLFLYIWVIQFFIGVKCYKPLITFCLFATRFAIWVRSIIQRLCHSIHRIIYFIMIIPWITIINSFDFIIFIIIVRIIYFRFNFMLGIVWYFTFILIWRCASVWLARPIIWII